jgi:hypothetical protein
MKSDISKVFYAFFLVACVMLFQNCGHTEQQQDPLTNFPFSTAPLYFKSTQKMVIEVYYEPGAEPYVGNTGAGKPYWNIFEDNLNAIFQYRSTKPVIIVPKVIADMTSLPTQGKTQWTANDILQLSSQHRQAEPTSTEAHFYIYFLKGYFDNGSGAQTGVIGVSMGGTPVIAMFKQVIQSTGTVANGPVPKYVEQSTLVHETGHALGFVNNGVPMVTFHQDTAHGAHTTNQDCVMYWQNEGTADLSQFVQKYISSGSTVMWGPEVLQDAQAYSQ